MPLKLAHILFAIGAWIAVVMAVQGAAYLLTYVIARAALSGALTLYVLRRWPAPERP